jgi:cyanophycinase
MAKGSSKLIAVGGGEMREATEVLEQLKRYLTGRSDPRVTVMTVATSDAEGAARKYNSLFRSLGIKHVDVVDVSQREDAFAEASLKKIDSADAIFFTGGDQLNITSLMGGTPLHNRIYERLQEGVLIIGTSAGAAMMSSSMIVSGKSDSPPAVGGVEIAPGMDMIPETIIDSHFSQRGRHGRLLTAIAHYPQVLGIGIDERTAIMTQNGKFTVIGEGTVTVMDGTQMRHTDLPYRKDDENVGMFGVQVHVLPSGYSFDVKARTPIAPELKKLAGVEDEV